MLIKNSLPSENPLAVPRQPRVERRVAFIGIADERVHGESIEVASNKAGRGLEACC